VLFDYDSPNLFHSFGNYTYTKRFMNSRRDFIKKGSLIVAGAGLLGKTGLANLSTPPNQVPYEMNGTRPPEESRRFVSKAVESVINKTSKKINDKRLAKLFCNCYPNTLDTTIDFEWIDGQPDTFVITGDIDAMWLRDSTAQVWPYLPLLKEDEDLKNLVKGLVNRQVKCVLLDPYANAFYKDVTRVSHWNSDRPQMKPGVHERKWEIDSLCYVIRLADGYYKETGDASIFTNDWLKAMRLIVDTFETEQQINGKSPYYFIRSTSRMLDAPFDGTGRPVKPVGLISSMFRPSDDATMFPFLIPSNLFAVNVLNKLTQILEETKMDTALYNRAKAISKEVETAVHDYAVQSHLDFGDILAYEVDGFGNKVYMDDANVPSLMSLAYIGYFDSENELYNNTRAFLLSDNNPYFLRGKAAEGQASPHTGKTNIWPMGIILRALTSTSDDEIRKCIHMLNNTHAETYFMHESFNKDDANNYSRSWFAWANTLFGELIIKVAKERPHLLTENYSA
jgi:meiotically up-regulated gene 157 (Mug157) protein